MNDCWQREMAYSDESEFSNGCQPDWFNTAILEQRKVPFETSQSWKLSTTKAAFKFFLATHFSITFNSMSNYFKVSRKCHNATLLIHHCRHTGTYVMRQLNWTVLTCFNSFLHHIWRFNLFYPGHFVTFFNQCAGISTIRYLWEACMCIVSLRINMHD